MLNSRMSRRSFLGVSAAGLAATVLDWNKINAFAETIGARQDYPTVVIGAGLGGLCCGAYLAQQGDCVRLVPVDDVIYFKASDKYTEVITRQGESLIRKPIKDLAGELDPGTFWQIYRGTIVNVRFIARVSRSLTGSGTVKLTGREEALTVSSRYMHLFKQM